MKAYNIQWDVNLDDFLETLREMSNKDAAKSLKIKTSEYKKMSEADIREKAREKFNTSKTSIAEFMGLPSEIEIPDCISHDDETISEWLSDTYEFCHNGFELTAVLSEYEVFATQVRDTQICKTSDTENEDNWMDYKKSLLLDIVYAENETVAVEQVAKAMNMETNVLWATQHTASISVPVEHDGKIQNKRFEAVSFKESDKTGIQISFDDKQILSIYIQDNKLRYYVN